MVGFRVMTETNTPDGSLFSDRQFLTVWTVGIFNVLLVHFNGL